MDVQFIMIMTIFVWKTENGPILPQNIDVLTQNGLKTHVPTRIHHQCNGPTMLMAYWPWIFSRQSDNGLTPLKSTRPQYNTIFSDPPDSPDGDRDPPLPLCYAIVNKIRCQLPALFSCVVCKWRGCWFHMWKGEVPGGKVLACYHCFGRNWSKTSPKSPLKFIKSYWMGNVKGRDFR